MPSPLRECLGHTVTLSSDFTLHHKQMCQLSVLANLLKNIQRGQARDKQGGLLGRASQGRGPGWESFLLSLNGVGPSSLQPEAGTGPQTRALRKNSERMLASDP